MLKTNIIINIQVEGIHNWPGCNIKEVDFLKFPHRHIFHICCKKQVTHEDRDIEIINFKRNITSFLVSIYGEPSQNVLLFGSKSCEMIAMELLTAFNLTYCSVLEDNENGAEIYK
jgi:hypothetical protein